MDLQKLRCFLVLAQELHFGRAATRLYLSQSGSRPFATQVTDRRA